MGAILVADFKNNAISYGTWGSLFLQQTYPFYEVVVVGNTSKNIMAELNATYLANTILVGSSVSSDISLFKDRFDDEETFIYVCQNNTCKLPVKTVKEAFEQMKSFGYQGFNAIYQ
jgi:hypothetical protein